MPGQLFVQLDASITTDISWNRASEQVPYSLFNNVINDFGISKISRPFILPNDALRRTYLFEFDKIDKTDLLIKMLETFSAVKYAEPVPVHQTFYIPNDPQYSTQWHLQTIQAEQAWDVITTQTSNVTIAVVDDAVLLNHNDLQASIWTNSNEIPNDNIDNDANGYIDDVNGWDAADNDNDPNPDNPTNTFFTHGTHCAGIAGARTDNNVGIASIGFNAQIMPVKTATLPNPGSITAGYAGVQYAIINNADVISLSWGGPTFSATYQLIFDQAYAQGIVCVAAAGNSNTSTPMYPASYNHVISVGATDQADQKAVFSNYGPTIDVMAPGVAIYSSLAGSNSSYGNLSGTSMACPMVAGLAGMLLACDPNLTPDDVENCIESTADDIYPVNPTYTGQLGAGRINAENAIICAKQIVAKFEANFTTACPNQSIQFTDQSSGIPISWDWSFPGGTPATSTLQNPVVTYASPGTYNVSLIVNDGSATDTLLKTAYITIATPQATLSGTSTIVQGYTGYIEFNFTGNPPWSATYSDGTNTFNINNITSTPYHHTVTPSDTTTYTITGFSDTLCTGNFNGTAIVNVLPTSASSTCYYTKYFGDQFSNAIHETYYDIVEDAVYVAGSHDGTPMFARFDPTGNLTFAVHLSSLSGGFSDIASAPNGDKLCVNNDNEDIVISRFTNTGILLWTKRYNNARERSVDIIKSQGDNYIIGCWHAPSGSSDDATFMRIDANGNILWTTRFHSLDDQIYELVPNGTGGAIFSGGIHGGGSVDMFVGEIDVNGVFGTIAEYNHSANVMNEALQVIKTINNEYVTASQINSANAAPWDANVMRLDANFDKIWEVNLTNPTGRINRIDGLTEDLQGNIYVACRYSDNTPDLGAIIKFDANGNFIWSKQIPDTRALKVRATNSTPVDNLIIARMHDGVNFGSNDCFLARTDTSLNSCIAAPVTTTFPTGVSTKTNLPYSTNTISFTTTSLILNPTTLSYQTNVICDSCEIDTSCINQVNANFLASTVCLGDTTYFTDQSATASGSIISWIWDLGDGNAVSGNPNPAHVYQNPGNYTVSLTVVNDTVPACYDSIVSTVEVVQYKLIMPADTTICIGDSLQLNPVTIDCGSPLGWTYSWSPSGSMNNPALSQPTVSPLVTTTYNLIATKGTDTLYGSVTITINPNCCVSHPEFQTNAVWCNTDSITFTNTSLSTGNATYTWNFGPNATPSTYTGTSPPPINFNGTGTFQVTLTLTDNCGTNTYTKNVIIMPLPSFDAGPDFTVCFPDTLALGDSTIAGYSYDWTPGLILDDSTISNPTAIVNGNVDIIVEVTDNWTGCILRDTVFVSGPEINLNLGLDDTICHSMILDAGNAGTGATYLWQDGSSNQTFTVKSSGTYSVIVTSGGCTKTDSIAITVQTVALDFTPTDTSGCLPLTVQFTGLASLSTGNISAWSWSFGDGKYASVQNPLHTYLDDGTYDVSLIAITNYGCSDTITKTAVVTAYPSAIASFNNSPAIGMTEEPIEFTNLSKRADNWIWTFGDDSPQSTLKNPTHVYQDPGQYMVTLEAINAHGCNDKISYTITVADEILIYVPNVFTPDNNDFNQTWKYSITGIDIYDFTMIVYNRWGQIVWQSHDPAAEWDGFYNGKLVQDGVYVWVMEFGDSVADKRHEYNGTVTILK